MCPRVFPRTRLSKAKAKTKDFKIVLEDPIEDEDEDLSSRTPTLLNSVEDTG